MAYKLVKKEYVRQRPKWLIRLLLLIPTRVYEICDTLDDVRAHLLVISETIRNMNLLEMNKKLHLESDEFSISIKSKKDRTHVKFIINTNYIKTKSYD